jgi:hypothetical protein
MFILCAEIPAGTKRVCTTCFGRIHKRLCQLEEGETSGTAATKKTDSEELVTWTDNEIELVKQSLR